MKRFSLAVLVSVALAFAACGGGDGGDDGGGGGGGGTTTTLDSAAAASLARFYGEGGVGVSGPGEMIAAYSNPPQKNLPQGCDQAGSWTGNTADGDRDGVYANATFQVNCDTSMSGGGYTYTVRVQGSITATDSDDNDPWVGRVEFAGLNPGEPFVFHVSSTYGSQTSTTEIRLSGYLASSRSGDSYVMEGNLSESASSPDLPMAYTMEFSGTGVFTPNGTWNPGEPADGTLSLDYTMSWSTSGMSTTVTGLSVSTPTPLQLSASCNEGAPVSGTLRIADGGNNVLEITWTGCGQYQATFNGQEITPAA